jgi:hypothetical protein
LWQEEEPQQEQAQEEHGAVFYVDGHRKAVYSDVLVPRGPVGKLGRKILGCRELVVLHDNEGHPFLATTHRVLGVVGILRAKAVRKFFSSITHSGISELSIGPIMTTARHWWAK